MAVVRIRPADELRVAVAAAIAGHSARIDAALPGVEIEHVGSTAIPGALTKGDLDLLVRVPADALRGGRRGAARPVRGAPAGELDADVRELRRP